MFLLRTPASTQGFLFVYDKHSQSINNVVMANTNPRTTKWATYEQYGACKKTHDMYRAFVAKREFAKHRNEQWDLEFEDWRETWWDVWEMRGRGTHQYQITRIDDQKPWHKNNILVGDRATLIAHNTKLMMQRREKTGKKHKEAI